MYFNSFPPPTAIQRFVGALETCARKALKATAMWLLRTDVVSKLIALPFLVFAIGYASQQIEPLHAHARS